MDPWGTPALTEYSCENFPSRTTESHQLLRKEEIRPNILPEIPNDLSLWRRPACQTLSKALDISSATAWVTPDLLKALAIQIGQTQNHTGNHKKGHISQRDQQFYYLQVFQRPY